MSGNTETFQYELLTVVCFHSGDVYCHFCRTKLTVILNLFCVYVNIVLRSRQEMATNIPAECPTCAKAGIRSAVALYQINLEEAAVLCEKPDCVFPMMNPGGCPLTVQRPAALMFSSHTVPKSKPRNSIDTDSMVSSCSASSWASHASTVSSISSSMTTPPPSISSKPFSWPSSQPTLVYQPVPVVPEQNIFDWINPISSVQSSPASSIFSVNDKEVELAMKSSSCYTPSSGLTPTPSPLLSEMLDTGKSETSEDIDAYLDAFSFLENIIDPPEIVLPTPGDFQPPAPKLDDSCVELDSAATSREKRQETPMAKQQDFREAQKSRKRLRELINRSNPLYKRPTSGTEASNSSTEAELKDKAVQQTNPLTNKKKVNADSPRTRSKVSRLANDTPSSSSASSSPKTKVAVDVNADGTPVFIIHPVVSPPVKQKPVRRPNSRKPTTQVPSKDNTKHKTDGPKRKAKNGEFCIETLVAKFVQAAKSKKLSETKPV